MIATYRRIPLSQGQFTVVDIADYDWLNQWKWTAQFNVGTGTFYAVRESEGGRIGRRRISMHRFILGLQRGDYRKGDHHNGDTLDNRRSNLRIATPSQNTVNSRLSKRNKSGFKGVCWSRTEKKWRSSVMTNGKRIFLGYFSSKESAFETYRDAALKHHGEFARLP